MIWNKGVELKYFSARLSYPFYRPASVRMHSQNISERYCGLLPTSDIIAMYELIDM